MDQCYDSKGIDKFKINRMYFYVNLRDTDACYLETEEIRKREIIFIFDA